MVTYVVASKANTNQLAQCQILGEHIEKNVPDCSVKFVIKDKCEWATFIDSVCRTYGFDEKKCPKFILWKVFLLEMETLLSRRLKTNIKLTSK